MKVGFIGLGVQGKYLAINEALAGFDLMVYDLRPEPLQQLAENGAKVARSNVDIGTHAEVVQVCVLNDAQLEAVVLGDKGVLAACKPGTVIVIHSTVRPSTITKVADLAKARGVDVIDAPVSGSENGAKNKTMSFMVGASEALFAKCRPLFEASGSKIVRAGELGSGIRAKLAHQLIICVNILAAYEGMKLGETAGVDIETLRGVIRDGMAQSRIAERWKQMSFNATARGVFYKDLQVCLEFGHELGLSLPAAALTQQMLEAILP